MFYLVLIVVGLVSVRSLAVDLLPRIEFTQLTVRIQYPNVGPQEIEQLITDPVENAVSGLPNLERVTSDSSEGSSRVRLDFVRGTPLLLQLFAIFYLPPLLGIDLSPFASGVVGLGLNGGAYTAEILRGGIQALPRGQAESGRALGMSAFQTARRIVLPQVVANVLPALANEAAALIKASSLVSALALVELTRVGYQVVSRILRPTEIYVAVGALYLLINALVSSGAAVAHRRLLAHR